MVGSAAIRHLPTRPAYASAPPAPVVPRRFLADAPDQSAALRPRALAPAEARPIDPDSCSDTRRAVVRAVTVMRDNLSRDQPLDELAKAGLFSPSHFHQIFREVTSVTPARFLTALRMAEARRLLLHSSLDVAEIAHRVGYASLGTFTSRFSALVGLAPGRFRHRMRSLGDVPLAAVLPAPSTLSAPAPGRALLHVQLAAQQQRLRLRLPEDVAGMSVAVGLAPVGELPRRFLWRCPTLEHSLPLLAVAPSACGGTECWVTVLVAHRDSTVAEVLGDASPARLLLARRQLTPSARSGGGEVRLRPVPPRPIDLPVLSAAPLAGRQPG
jgi:AraC family transcriptional regulator